MPHSMALHFALLYRYCDFFYKLKVRVSPEFSKPLNIIFSNSICSLHVSVSCFGNSQNISNFFTIIIRYFKLRSLIFDATIAKYYNSLKPHLMAFFSKKHCLFAFRNNAITNVIEYRIV